SPVFRASRYSTASTEPVPQVHPERNKNLGIYLLSPIEKTDPRHGACQSATAARGTPRISRRSGQAQSAGRLYLDGSGLRKGRMNATVMSALGQTPTSEHVQSRSALPLKADITDHD